MLKSIKIILVGDSRKSCLLSQFIEERFNQIHDPTLGLEFSSKILNIDKEDIKLLFWDMAGNKDNKYMARSYYKDTDCAIIVYDVTLRESFKNVIYWLEEAKHYAQSDKSKKNLLLVANKIDELQRAISTEEGQDFARKNNLIYFEASAKTGRILMTQATKIVLREQNHNLYSSVKFQVHLGKEESILNLKQNLLLDYEKKKKCC